jgi:hypothetical protein
MSGTKAVGYLHGTVTWTSSASLFNPGAGTVIVDTGALVAGNYLVGVDGSADAAWVYDVEYRDSTNTTTLQFVRRRPASGNDDLLFPNKILVSANERVRVVSVSGGGANVQLSLFTMEMG